MKNHIIKITLGLLLFASYKSYAGLDWTYGSLTNADGLHRYFKQFLTLQTEMFLLPVLKKALRAIGLL